MDKKLFKNCSLLIACVALSPTLLRAEVIYDSDIPQVCFAADELKAAIKESGEDQLKIKIQVESDPSSPEAFKIKKADSQILITGTDITGAMYGGLEVADLLKLGLSIENREQKPFIQKRGIKFNIAWDARNPSYDDTGDAAQNNIITMWDFKGFWKPYLDDLARYRYNVLSLWSTHPFPSMVKLEDYPDVALNDVYRVSVPIQPDFKNKLQNLDQNGDGHLDLEHDSAVMELVKEITIDEKIAHWQRVFQYAQDRGIEIQLFQWNVFTFGATGKYGITQDQTNPITVDYMRQCVKQALLTYPQITTIGVTAGENADRKMNGKHSTENFIFNSFGRAVMDLKEMQPERDVHFIFRRHVTEHERVTEAFKNYPGTVDSSTKYAVAHMYSSRRPQEWETRIVKEGWLDSGYKIWLNLRNDDIAMHRWGSPDYAREFIKWMPHEHMAGFYMGSDGYVWGREFICKNPETAGRLEIDKHWYKFRLWGQLAYNNDLNDDYWDAVIKHRFPGVDSRKMLDAWQTVSEVIPQLNRAVWAPTDGDFSGEGCMQRSGFLTLDDYYFSRDPMPLTRIPNAPDPQCISVTAWAKARLAGQTLTGLTPLQVADNLDSYAAEAQAALPELRMQAGDNAELQETLNDIDSMAYLGRYYADKMRGAAKLALFREDRSQKQYNAEAVAHLKDAVEEWKAYAAILTPQYKTQLLARTHFLDWNTTLKDVEQEVLDVAREGDFPDVVFVNLKNGDKLPENTELKVEVNATDKDGIKKVKLYLNGLLLNPEQPAKGMTFAWSGSSDELLKSLKSGTYHLNVMAEDTNGIRNRKVIEFTVGKGLNGRTDAWKDEIYQVIMKDGEHLTEAKEFNFTRLESKLLFTDNGRFLLHSSNDGLVWKTWSKDEDHQVHYAAFEEGQIRMYRGKPGKKDNVLLWYSPKPKGEGPYTLGITAAGKMVVFQDDDGNNIISWRSH